MSKLYEYPDLELCPCGSNKVYKDCCKLKKISYVFDEKGQLTKQIPMDDLLVEKLEEERCKFQDYYGRLPDKNDFVLSFSPVYNDRELLKMMSAMKESGIPDPYIYAYYKTGGLLPCSLNEDLMSEADIEEYEAYKNEYTELMGKEMGESIPSIQFVVLANAMLTETLDVQKMLADVLNDFIHRHSEELWKKDSFSIQSELDYLVFSALKTIKTLTGIQSLLSNRLTECIVALGRSLFENYLYLNRLNEEDTFFEKKLLPKADILNYKFVTQRNGRPSFSTVENINTGEIFNIRVVISDLKSSLHNQADIDLYELFYSNACQYVHVDVCAADKYFYSFDPYDEVDPSLCAATISSAITLLVCMRLFKTGMCRHNSKRTQSI